MFLITQTNRLRSAVEAVVAVPVRARSVEVPVVCVAGAALLTRPKVEVRNMTD